MLNILRAYKCEMDGLPYGVHALTYEKSVLREWHKRYSHGICFEFQKQHVSLYKDEYLNNEHLDNTYGKEV